MKRVFDSASEKRKNSPFMRLFNEEQMKFVMDDPQKVEYHPIFITFCLCIHVKSPAAYEQLRLSKDGTGVLILPSQPTLRNYRNYIHPKRGFNHQIVNEITVKTKNFSELEKYVLLTFDEMKIQNDLVWDQHTG